MVRTTPRERSVVRRPGGFCLHLSGSAAPFTARDRCLLLPFLATTPPLFAREPPRTDARLESDDIEEDIIVQTLSLFHGA